MDVWMFGLDLATGLDSAFTRQPNIHYHYVWLEFGDGLDGFLSGSGLADCTHTGQVLQQGGKPQAHDLMVIHQEYADFIHGTSPKEPIILSLYLLRVLIQYARSRPEGGRG